MRPLLIQMQALREAFDDGDISPDHFREAVLRGLGELAELPPPGAPGPQPLTPGELEVARDLLAALTGRGLLAESDAERLLRELPKGGPDQSFSTARTTPAGTSAAPVGPTGYVNGRLRIFEVLGFATRTLFARFGRLALLISLADLLVFVVMGGLMAALLWPMLPELPRLFSGQTPPPQVLEAYAPAFLVLWLAGLLLAMYAMTALVAVTGRLAADPNDPLPMGAFFMQPLRRMFPLLGLCLLAVLLCLVIGLAILVISGLGSLLAAQLDQPAIKMVGGAGLIILYGVMNIWLVARLVPSSWLVVNGRLGPWRGLKAAWRSTKGATWRMIGLMLSLLLIQFLVMLPLSLAGQYLLLGGMNPMAMTDPQAVLQQLQSVSFLEYLVLQVINVLLASILYVWSFLALARAAVVLQPSK